jgi:tetratricopeptide (TPR) repeat protein
MKRITGLLLALLLSCGALWAREDARELFTRANQAYEAGQYDGAVALYDSLVALGYGSLELWFNKGNSHYRLGETGPAILCWRRAEALAPFDRDVQKNLEIAGRLLEDDLGESVRLPLWNWIDRLLEAIPRDLSALALLAVLALWSALACLRILGRLGDRGPVPGLPSGPAARPAWPCCCCWPCRYATTKAAGNW